MEYQITLKVGSDKEGCSQEAVASLGALARMIADGSLKAVPQKRMPGKGSLGARAKDPMGLFDLSKQEISNQYAEPEETGEHQR